MKTSAGVWIAVAAQALLLAACVPAVMAPTTVALPGPGKSQVDFVADQNACSALANQQTTAAKAAANNSILTMALVSDVGTVAATAQNTTASVQQQFDAAYSSCMYAKGDTVPGYVGIAAPVEDRPVRRARKPAPKADTQAGNATFVEPPPTSGAASGSTFAEPPAAHR